MRSLRSWVGGAWMHGALIAVAACGGSNSSSVIGGSGPNVPDGGSCTTDGNCMRPTPYCDVTTSRCVECLSTTNCAGDLTCNTTLDTCVECVGDTQCGGNTPYCGPAGTCVACLSAGNCATGQSCNAANRCEATCTSDSQCHAPTSHCDMVTAFCVECLTSAQCTSRLVPVCNTSANVCVECAANADCKTTQTCDTTVGVCR